AARRPRDACTARERERRFGLHLREQPGPELQQVPAAGVERSGGHATADASDEGALHDRPLTDLGHPSPGTVVALLTATSDEGHEVGDVDVVGGRAAPARAPDPLVL